MRVRTVLMTMPAALLLLTRPDAQVLGEKPSDHWADIAQGQLPEAFAVFTAATVNGIVVAPSGLVSFVDATGATIHAPAPLPLATEVTLPPGFVTLAMPNLKADVTLTSKGGRITEQWDVTIKAPATISEADWAVYLRAQWPIVMMKIAQRLKDCGCTVLGLKDGAAETSIGRIWGPLRALAFRFTRNSSTIAVHIDVLAGK